MKKYGWQAVYMSFFSGDLYRDVAQNWRGVGYLYLLFVSLGVSAIVAIGVQIACNTMIGQNVDPIVAKWPTLTVQNGTFSIDKESPYIIPMAENYILDFDTTDDAKFPEGKKGWMVTKTAVKQYGMGNAGEPEKEVFEANSVGTKGTNMVIDKTALTSWVGTMKAGVGLFVFIFKSIALVLMCMLQSLIYGLIGMLIAKAMKINLTYGTCVRLAVVAMTPWIIIETLSDASMHHIELGGIISIVVALGYLVFAIKANMNSVEPTPTVIAA